MSKKKVNIKKQKQELNKALGLTKVLADEVQKKIKPKETLKNLKENTSRKTLMIGGGVLAALVFITIAYTQFTKPRLGSQEYALCRVFLELNVTYPDYLRLASVREYWDDDGNRISRIWYAQLDAFGQNRMERIQCYYRPTENYTRENPEIYLDRITIDRREIDRKKVADFNALIPALRTGYLNLELPKGLPDSIGQLKYDPNFGRKRLF